MFLITWVILGVVAAIIVNKVIYRNEPGLIGDIILGVLGAVVGGFVFNFGSAGGASQFNPFSLAFAGMGALLMLGAFHALRRTGRGFQ